MTRHDDDAAWALRWRRAAATTCAALVMSAMAAVPAQAHTFQLAIGEAARATHHFGVICSTDGGAETDHLFIQVQTLTPSPALLSVVAVKGTAATSTTDAVSGDAAFSPALRLKGGNGVYQVLVTKTGAGRLVFNITAHCMDASGVLHTGTDALVHQYEDS